MAKGIMRQLKQAQYKAYAEMAAQSKSGNHITRGLAPEGFTGGYVAALNDVSLALNGVTPNNSRYWPQPGDPPVSNPYKIRSDE